MNRNMFERLLFDTSSNRMTEKIPIAENNKKKVPLVI